MFYLLLCTQIHIRSSVPHYSLYKRFNFCQVQKTCPEKLKVNGDLGGSEKKWVKIEDFDRKTESRERNLEGFPLCNYLKRQKIGKKQYLPYYGRHYHDHSTAR